MFCAPGFLWREKNIDAEIDSAALDRALELLVCDRSPRGEIVSLRDDERAMVYMAQRIRGTRLDPPSETFMTQLRARLANLATQQSVEA